MRRFVLRNKWKSMLFGIGSVSTFAALNCATAMASPIPGSKCSDPTKNLKSKTAKESLRSEETKTDDSALLYTTHQRNRRWSQLKLFSGTANPALAEEVAKCLGTSLSPIDISRFADGEIGIRVFENVRGKDAFIIQPTCPPGVNDNLIELILLISTMRRASARSITAILPYYGYARQDRKMQSRVPISAADVARLLEAMGVDRVIAVDLHCGQIQGFFGPCTPCDNLDGAIVALKYFKDLITNDTIIVSPDAGGVYRAKRFRDDLVKMGMGSVPIGANSNNNRNNHNDTNPRNFEVGLAMIVKQRQAAGQIQQMDLVGDVDGKDCIIVDDMIDTAGTLCKAGAELKRRGAKRIFAFATHGLFNGPAIDRINNSDFEEIVICNTVPLREDKTSDKIVQLSIASLLAKVTFLFLFFFFFSEIYLYVTHSFFFFFIGYLQRTF